MSKTLCFGGSFNPVHVGHLICARAAAEAAGFTRVLLIPSAHPPHKPHSLDLAPAEHRLAMCRLAAEASGGLFDVSDLELRRTGPSYTLSTVRELKADGLSEVWWLVGADTLTQLLTWHEPHALLAETRFLVMRRPGSPVQWDQLPPALRDLRQNVVDAPLIDITATDIRRRVAAAKPIDFLVPPAVAEYIRSHGLYR